MVREYRSSRGYDRDPSRGNDSTKPSASSGCSGCSGSVETTRNAKDTEARKILHRTFEPIRAPDKLLADLKELQVKGELVREADGTYNDASGYFQLVVLLDIRELLVTLVAKKGG